MKPAVRQVILGRGLLDPASATLRKYGTPALYVGDTNPLLYTQSGLPPSYLESTGVTPASASAQTLGLYLEGSQGAALGAELSDPAQQTGQNTTSAVQNGAGFDIVASGNFAGIRQTVLTTGLFYRVTVSWSGNDEGRTVLLNPGGGSNPNFGTAASGTGTALCIAGGTTAQLYLNGSAATETFYLEFTSIKLIAGNHIYQATAADEPTLINSSNLWRLRGDGVSDNFLTTWSPAAASTMLAAVSMNAVSDVVMGASVGTNIFRLMTGADGKARLVAGTTAVDISAASIVDIPGTIGVAVTGTTYYGFWKPFGGVAETATGSFSGSIPTTQPIRLLAENDDGTAVSFGDGDAARALAQASFYSAAEFAAIARQWEGGLGGFT
jgi:hypothetical protein